MTGIGTFIVGMTVMAAVKLALLTTHKIVVMRRAESCNVIKIVRRHKTVWVYVCAKKFFTLSN